MCLRASQKRRNEISLQDPIGTDNEGNEMTLVDVLGTDGDEVHAQVERRISLQQVRELVTACLRGREKTVIEMRYGLLDGKSYAQQEVAQKLGISRSYVSRRHYCKRCPKACRKPSGIGVLVSKSGHSSHIAI